MAFEEHTLLFARLDDMCGRAEKGELVYSAFLSPRQIRAALDHLSKKGTRDRAVCFGGYTDAERQRIFILPDYISDVSGYADISIYFERAPIEVLRICGSGYRKLTHRDHLGSLLSLGIERDVLGDIVFETEESFCALLFCDSVISDFLLTELTHVANDTVKVSRTEISEDFVPYRNFLRISDTVSSARIDCVVAALCSLSREKARAAVLSETVEVDFAPEIRPDRQISAPCIVSVRGYGRYRINSVSEQTRKGRFRLSADKYL